MRRALTAIALVASLAGCAGGQIATPAPMPTPAQIAVQQGQFAAVTDVPGFYQAGLTMAQMNCGAFFDGAVVAELQREQQQSALGTASSVVLGSLGLAGVAGAPISAVGLGTTALNQLSLAQANATLGGPDPAATATLVSAAQQKLIGAEGTPVSPAAAYQAIYDVYRACSPAGIEGLKEQAIAAAPNHLQVVGQPPVQGSLMGWSAAPGPHMPLSVGVR